MKLVRETLLRGSETFPFALYHMHYENQSVLSELHWQDDTEIIHVTGGEIKITVDGAFYHLCEGDLICINPGQIHCLYGSDTYSDYDVFIFPWEHLLFYHADHDQHEYLLPLSDKKYGLPTFFANHEVVRNLMLKAIESLRQHPPGYEIMVKALLLQMLCVLIQNNELVTVSLTRQDETCKSILNYIHDHYSEKLTIRELSGKMGISRTYFSSFFSTHFHQGFAEYLINYRIEKSCIMLSTSTQSIAEIAQVCGFHSSSHFIRNFKKKKGITPSVFRNQVVKRPLKDLKEKV